ncbi:unnamed protein product [Darwinula stevensoni]|uniref:Intersectin-1 n=1 Tax=Darwinula stevensoni TaxID=69355 RepID=A0A7R8X2U2_9CRUS|nr:unnamed protein product [Darwinula stevensoni]CAG0883810.1 unnamed protein product [Darwinula stevensoni]
MDPWAITPAEQQRHENHFKALNPVGGMITGAQAKGFLLQSQLPPAVLAQIWALADVNGDGKMDIMEFSIACKLITNKLKGMELPKFLPPGLKLGTLMSPPVVSPPTSIQTPPVMSPPSSVHGPLPMGNIPPIGAIQPMPMAPTAVSSPPLLMSSAPNVGVISSAPLVTSAFQQPIHTSSVPQGIFHDAGLMSTGVGAAIPTSLISVVKPTTLSQLPLTSTPPASAGGRRSSDMMSPPDWAIPQPSKLKYTQQFNQADKLKSGYLTGQQARSLLLQTSVQQTTLAKIWSLADVDGDGRLTCEEFVLAMHLTDVVKRGETLPVKLSLDLIPPSFRRPGSKPGTPGSLLNGMGPQVLPHQPPVEEQIAKAIPASFEDKRKENFDRGNAELERRRKALQEQEERELEERRRKEREEQERLEKIRLEQEAKKKAELEAQLERQRELQRAREEEQRRLLEQKEAARKEAERQRQLEWEKQRRTELLQIRQREQEKVLHLKSQKQTVSIQVTQLTDKIKELTEKMSEARKGVAQVKGTIDGMRVTRDTKLAEISNYKTQLREQNQRLMQVIAEKTRLSEKSRISATNSPAGQDLTALAVQKAQKEAAIQKLKEKAEEMETLKASRMGELEKQNEEMAELKQKLSDTHHNLSRLYQTFSEKRRKVLEIRENQKNERIRAAIYPTTVWEDLPSETPKASPSTTTIIGQQLPIVGLEQEVKYQAIYAFEARNPDELSLNPGDIVLLVPSRVPVEPGWLHGKVDGRVGIFPEAYVEPLQAEPEALEPEPAPAFVNANEAAEVPTDGILDYARTLYPYEPVEAGDLRFNEGEVVCVTKKDGDWWSGYVGDPSRSGLFPANYVTCIDPPTEVDSCEAPENTQPAFPPPLAGEISQIDAGPEPFGKGKKVEIAQVIAPYTATTPEQLSLIRGQLIQVKKKSSSGWWEGELQAKGQKKKSGWFPASYVKVKSGSGSVSSSTRTSPLPRELADFETTAFPFNIREEVVALFPYEAQNDDELTFAKGDHIIVTEHISSDWWKGDLHGIIGVFPANHVEVLKTLPDLNLPASLTDTLTRTLNSLSPVEKKRQAAIQELISTEQAYVNDISFVLEVFAKPLVSTGALTQEESNMIFVNWEDLYVCNNNLLRALRVRKKMSEHGIIHMIGDVLCENIPCLTPYIRFCSCQLKAAALIQKKTESVPLFQETVKQCQSDPRAKGMPLSSFLLKPMQRITRYPLTFKEILNHTPLEHADRGNMEEALSKAEELCSQVNEGVRETENSDRLEWMQGHINCESLSDRLTFNSLTNALGPRKFLHYGPLYKSKSGKELMGFLCNDFLLLVAPNSPLPKKSFVIERNPPIFFRLYREPIMLNELLLSKAEDYPEETHFVVKGLDHVISLRAPSPTEKNLWMRRFQDAINSYAQTEKSLLQRKASEVAPKGRVLVTVQEAYKLVRVGKCDAYCEVSIGSQVSRTRVVPGTNHPKWNASMQFKVKDLKEDVLCFTVYHKAHFAPNEFLGRTEMRLSDVMEESGATHGAVIKRLLLFEVESGELVVKFHLQLFNSIIH